MPWLFQFKNSAVWWLGYRLHGQQFLRSTGHRDRAKAEQEMDRAKSMIHAHKANALSQDLFQNLTGKAAPNVTLKAALDDWLNEATGAAGPRTVEKYQAISDGLTSFFKANDNGPMLADIATDDLTRFLGEKRATVSAATANLTRKCLAIFFKRSKARGFVRENPVETIKTFKLGHNESRARRPFTIAELGTLYKVAPDDFWRYMVVGGFCTGLRLGDLVTMPLGAVDWKSKCIRITTRKTGKPITIPITPEFLKILKQAKLERGGAGQGDFFWPEHAERYLQSGAGWYSQRFYDLLLVPAGLAKSRPHRPGKKAKSTRRMVNEVSFHCLRHSCVTTHAANRENQQLVKALVGHSSDDVNDLYTTLPLEVLQGAVKALPDITR